MAQIAPIAPKDVCKRGDSVAGWYGILTRDKRVKRNYKCYKEDDLKIRDASAFTLEEQKEMDDWTCQAREIERKAVAVIRTTSAEARLFNEKGHAVATHTMDGSSLRRRRSKRAGAG